MRAERPSRGLDASATPFRNAIAPTRSFARKHAFVMNPGSPPECWIQTVSPFRTAYQPMHQASSHLSPSR